MQLINIQGLVHANKICVNSAKIEKLSAMVQSNDIIAITETFFNKFTDKELLLSLAKSHQVIRADRQTDIGGKTKNGGAMILIPNMFIIKSKLVFSNGFVEVAGVVIEPLQTLILNKCLRRWIIVCRIIIW